MKRLGWCATAAGVTALLLATACGSNSSDPSAEEPTTADSTTRVTPLEVEEPSRLERAVVTVTVSGDVNLEWRQETDLRIVTVTGTDPSFDLFSIGLEEHHATDQPTRHFRWAFDVLGRYSGAGRYDIASPEDGAGMDVAGLEAGLRSGAFFLDVTVVDDDAEPRYGAENIDSIVEYNELIEGCTVDVTEREETGVLTCPALGDHEGRQIDLEARWEVV